MQFGNWNFTDQGLTYNGGDTISLTIPTDQLTRLTQEGEKPAMYQWVLQVSEHPGLDHDDIYDFNYAFVYAIAKAGLDFDYGIFDETLAEQFELFGFEDDEE
jgi:hypothetical protein